MVANQKKYSRLEQRSAIRFLVAEKCKQYEYYRRMCSGFREECFSQRNAYKWAKNKFATISWSQKDSP